MDPKGLPVIPCPQEAGQVPVSALGNETFPIRKAVLCAGSCASISRRWCWLPRAPWWTEQSRDEEEQVLRPPPSYLHTWEQSCQDHTKPGVSKARDTLVPGSFLSDTSPSLLILNMLTFHCFPVECLQSNFSSDRVWKVLLPCRTWSSASSLTLISTLFDLCGVS